jgi:transcriptional regulator GlxA family with amidase domain
MSLESTSSRGSAAIRTVAIVVFDGCDELDVVGPWEVLAAAGLTVRAVALESAGRDVRADHGMRFGVDGVVGDAPADLLVVPGGGWLTGSSSGVRRLVEDGALAGVIARLHAAGTVVASVCTGSMLLGAAGLLAGRPAVTNRLALDDLAGFGALVAADARVVDDGDLVTAGGPACGLDLGIHLVGRALGSAAAGAAADRLEYLPQGPVVRGPAAAPAATPLTP